MRRLVYERQVLAVTVPPLVSALAVVLVGAAFTSYVCSRIGLVPIVGYVLAGVIVGPYALGLVSDVDLVEQAAEVGVIFLLFGIGLELSGDRLRQLGSLLLGGGAIQVGLTVALVTGTCLVFGVEPRTAIYTGCLVSLSSTAVVLKLLSGRDETNSPVGDVAVAFLIFQDLAVVMMVLLVPMLGEGGGDLWEILVLLAKSVLVIGFVMAASTWLIPRALDRVADHASDEVFLLSIAALALVIAYAATLLGLTDSLGAFIAGLVISSGRHRERALRYITPFQMLFSAIFFASIGMLLDPSFLIDRWQLVLVLAIGAVLIKVISTGVAARVFQRPMPVIIASSLLLAQVGEFSFVLEQSGRAVGLTPAGVGAEGSQAFIGTAVLLFVLTPMLDTLGRRLVARRERAAPIDQAG
jgi:CPA2 family monovalent cation:H+ antiporter-2